MQIRQIKPSYLWGYVYLVCETQFPAVLHSSSLSALRTCLKILSKLEYALLKQNKNKTPARGRRGCKRVARNVHKIKIQMVLAQVLVDKSAIRLHAANMCSSEEPQAWSYERKINDL